MDAAELLERIEEELAERVRWLCAAPHTDIEQEDARVLRRLLSVIGNVRKSYEPEAAPPSKTEVIQAHDPATCGVCIHNLGMLRAKSSHEETSAPPVSPSPWKPGYGPAVPSSEKTHPTNELEHTHGTCSVCDQERRDHKIYTLAKWVPCQNERIAEALHLAVSYELNDLIAHAELKLRANGLDHEGTDPLQGLVRLMKSDRDHAVQRSHGCCPPAEGCCTFCKGPGPLTADMVCITCHQKWDGRVTR